MHTFCCCLPVRFGVFVMGLLGLVLGGFVAGVGWQQIVKLTSTSITEQNKIALYIQTVMYTILAIVSFFGLIGAIARRRSLISVYFTMLFLHFAFSVGTGAFYLYSLFHEKKEQDLQTCLNGSTDTITKDICKGTTSLARGLAVGIFIVIWLIEFYGLIIVSRYSQQLEEEEALDMRLNPPMPQMVTTYNTAPANYTFATPQNSYGGRPGSSV